MEYEFLPVDPLRTKGGALVTLIGLLGDESAATPEVYEGMGDTLTSFRIFQDSLSASQAATLGVGSIFKGSFSANEQALTFDAVVFTDQYNEQTQGKSILAVRWGLGMRILLRVSQIKGDVSLNFGLVGAAVQLGYAQARYEIIGHGLGVDAFSDVLGSLSPLDDFSYETYLKLKGPVVDALKTYLRQHAAGLQPVPIAVALSENIDRLSIARSVNYSMKKIYGRRTLSEALASAKPEMSVVTIESVYLEVTGTNDRDKRPSDSVITRAGRWLDV